MSIKVILAPVTGEKSETVALEVGLDLATRFNSHLRALHISPGSSVESKNLPGDLLKVLSNASVKSVLKEAEAQSMNRAKLARELFSVFCSENDVKVVRRARESHEATAAWEEKKGDPQHVIPIVGRLADLIVICRPTHKLDRNTGRFIQATLFETGSPLLLVPRTPTKTMGKRIAIAWDRSGAAKRAVLAALPLLKEAEAVRIIRLGEPNKLGPDVRQLSTYLKWHGIETDIVSRGVIRKAAEEALLDAFKDFRADMVVMGAYTSNRFKQRIFGGVTRRMLNMRSMPVLFHT